MLNEFRINMVIEAIKSREVVLFGRDLDKLGYLN